MENRPDSSAVISRVNPVCVFVTVIVAFGTTAPDGSSTVPTMDPYRTWL